MKGLPELVIGDLKVKRPVIQGGMGVGVSLGQLAGAVAKEGGVGIISTAQIGFREPDFETNTRAANIRAIGSEFQRARETAPDGVIGFNIMVALKDYDEHVKAAVDAGADLIVSGAGLPIELPGLVEGSWKLIHRKAMIMKSRGSWQWSESTPKNIRCISRWQ